MKKTDFPPEQLRVLYRAIYERRDIRQFRDDPVPSEGLARIIKAAHHGPPVGYMQPWDFILVSDVETRRRVKDLLNGSDRQHPIFSTIHAVRSTFP